MDAFSERTLNIFQLEDTRKVMALEESALDRQPGAQYTHWSLAHYLSYIHQSSCATLSFKNDLKPPKMC